MASILGLGYDTSDSESEDDVADVQLRSESTARATVVAAPPVPDVPPPRVYRRKEDQAFSIFGQVVRKKTAAGRLPVFGKRVAERDSDSEDEDVVIRKRLKTKQCQAQATGLLGFLPRPIHSVSTAKPETSELDAVFSRKHRKHAGVEVRQAEEEASEEPEPVVVQPVEPVLGAAELYRVDESGNYVHAAAYQQQEYVYQREEARPPARATANRAQELLTSRMQAEQDRQGLRRQHINPKGVHITEIRADSLTAMDLEERTKVEAVRIALGTSHAKKLRDEVSGSNRPSKLAKRKHQIGSLYHQAKVNELQGLEKKSRTMQTKAETHAKYGW